MVESATEIGQKLIEKLVNGKMVSHPLVAFHIQKAILTRDYAALLDFLNRYPVFVAMAERNIALAEYQKKLNPFQPYPSREKAGLDLNGPIKFGFINEFDNLFGVDPDTFCTLTMILGRPGSGKSILNKYLLTQILRKPQNFNVIIPDVKPEYHLLVPYARNLKVLTPKMIKLNPFMRPPWMTTEEHINFITEVFIKENWLATTSQNELKKIIEGLFKQRGIYEGTENYPSMRDLYQEVIRTSAKKESYRIREVLSYVENRISPYASSETFNCQVGLPDDLWRDENLVLMLGVGDTETGPKTDILGQASMRIRTKRYVDFPG